MYKRFKRGLTVLLTLGLLMPLFPAVPSKGAAQALFNIGNGNIYISVVEPENADHLVLSVEQQGFDPVTYDDFSTQIVIAGQSDSSQVVVDTDVSAFQGLEQYQDQDLAFTVNLLLSALSITGNQAAISLRRGTTAHITFTGITTLQSGSGYAGLHVAHGAQVTLTGQADAAGMLGSLRAYAGANAAGIGSNSHTVDTGSVNPGFSGDIIIQGGFVTAKGNGTAYDIGGSYPLSGRLQILGGSVWPVNGRTTTPYYDRLASGERLYPVSVPLYYGTQPLFGLQIDGPYLAENGLTRTVSSAMEHGSDFPAYLSAMIWLPAGNHHSYQVGNYPAAGVDVVAGTPAWNQNRLYWGYQPTPAFDLAIGDIRISKSTTAGMLTVDYGNGKTPVTLAADGTVQIYMMSASSNNRIVIDGDGLHSAVKLELICLNLSTTAACLDLINQGIADITLSGENRLSSTNGAAIHVPVGSYLTIGGDVENRLIATAGGNSAAIGGQRAESNGTIVINGGTIVATGHRGGAGIGAGTIANAGKIIINGGILIATGPVGNDSGGFDIGSGSNAKNGVGTEINGGNIYCSNNLTANKIEKPTNGRTAVYPVTISHEYRGLQAIESSILYHAFTITDALANGTNFPYQIAACIWIPAGTYEGTITVGPCVGGCATVVASPKADENIVYWKSAIIVTDSLPSATVDQYYIHRLVAINEGNPNWSIVAGALPPGIVLSGNAITGIPTRAGTYSFTLMVISDNGVSQTRALRLLVNTAPLTPEQPGAYQDKDTDPAVYYSSGTRTVKTDKGNLSMPYLRDGSLFIFDLDHNDSLRITNLADKEVTFDVSDLNGVHSLSMRKTALNRLRDAGLKVHIVLPLGTFTLTPPAITAMVQKTSDMVTFTIKKPAANTLNVDQRNAVGSNAVFQVAAYTGSEQITVFDVPITVTLPYSITAGTNNFGVWNMDKWGLTETLDFQYNTATRTLTVETKYLSHFILGYDTSWHSPFTDVSSSDGFYSDVRFLVLNGIDNGTTDTAFSPYASLTRAALVTMLGKLSGVNINLYANAAFADVPSAATYTKYVRWAQSNNIVSGVGNNEFAPDRAVTREELAVILIRFNSYMNKTLPIQRNAITFSDRSGISSWAVEPATLLYQANVMDSYNGTAFHPKGLVTRAEFAAILHRYAKLVI